MIRVLDILVFILLVFAVSIYLSTVNKARENANNIFGGNGKYIVSSNRFISHKGFVDEYDYMWALSPNLDGSFTTELSYKNDELREVAHRETKIIFTSNTRFTTRVVSPGRDNDFYSDLSWAHWLIHTQIGHSVILYNEDNIYCYAFTPVESVVCAKKVN